MGRGGWAGAARVELIGTGMNTIDFLPARYGEQNAARQKQLWQITVLLLFGTVVAAAAVFQFTMRRSASEHLVEVELKHFDARLQNDRLATLQSELKSARQTADLFAYLMHPWPRTRILAAVTDALPESVSLDEIRIGREADSAATRTQRRRFIDAKQQDKQIPPAVRDLSELRSEIDELQVVVSITGITTDPVELHRFVSQLGSGPIFEKADLGTQEALKLDSATVTRFAVRLVVRPGFGQPGGPTGDSRTTASSANHRVGGRNR